MSLKQFQKQKERLEVIKSGLEKNAEWLKGKIAKHEKSIARCMKKINYAKNTVASDPVWQVEGVYDSHMSTYQGIIQKQQKALNNTQDELLENAQEIEENKISLEDVATEIEFCRLASGDESFKVYQDSPRDMSESDSDAPMSVVESDDELQSGQNTRQSALGAGSVFRRRQNALRQSTKGNAAGNVDSDVQQPLLDKTKSN